MPKRTITEKDKGVREETPDVIVIFRGDESLVWESQNFHGDGDTVEFTLLPGVKEAFNAEYAKAVFGNWELPRVKKRDEKIWADMVKDRVDRSPSADGCLPMVEIYEAGEGDKDDVKLWDAAVEFAHWIERHGATMLPKPNKKSGITVEMPKILAEADGDTLKKLWLHSFKGSKMPPALSYADARSILVPRLSADQIADVLVAEFEKEPDMSQYDKKT